MFAKVGFYPHGSITQPKILCKVFLTALIGYPKVTSG